jgi:trehalose 2-sulfotransferase
MSTSSLPAPERAYLVLATARSGSTLLCEALRQTGVAGRPLEHFEVLEPTSLPRQPREYFHGVTDQEILNLLPPLQPGSPRVETPAQWWARIVREGIGDNGVWGGKLMWAHTRDLLHRTRRLDGLAHADLATTLDTLLRSPALIFMVREDKIGQAVSLWRAVQTQTWRGSAVPDQAVYRFGGIDHLRRQLQADEAQCRTWLASNHLHPYEVRYSELAADPAVAIDGVLRFLDLPSEAPAQPPLERQADDRSAQWAQRYVEECAS